MTILKASSLEGFLLRRDSKVGALLIYGEDGAAVRQLAGKAVQHLAGSLDDPFSVTTLEENDLSGDSARLIDEVQSQSLLGGGRVIWVRGVGQSFLKAVEPILAGATIGNIIIAEAGNLPKQSGLRSKFETSERAAIIPVYESDTATIAENIRAQLRLQGLRIDDDAQARLIELTGRGAMTLRGELEKLELYCQGRQTVTLEDVESVCGDALWAETSDLADAIFSGDILEADRFFMQLVSSGVDPGRMLSAAHAHSLRLLELRQNADRGMAIDQVVRAARPPIFFKRQATLRQQLFTWTTESLLSAAHSLHVAIAEERLNTLLGESLASRALLAVTRMARAHRARVS
jgi:DNA polymerase-3 subunit delta